jgi:Ni,Fe-hydrogenase III small subunit
MTFRIASALALAFPLCIIARTAAPQPSPATSFVVVFDEAAPFTSFPSGIADDRTRATPEAWEYLDPAVLGTVQTLEAQFGIRAEHVYSAAIRGFSARLTREDVAALRRLPFVTSIEPDSLFAQAASQQSATITDATNFVIRVAACPQGRTIQVLDRRPGAPTTQVEFGACDATTVWTSAVLKAVDWITAHADDGALVDLQLAAEPDSTLSTAVTRSARGGLTYTASAFAIPSGRSVAPAAQAVSTLASVPGAAAYNLKIVSDASPDVSDLASLVESATSRWASPAEKVWALFYWTHMLKGQTPPMVLHGFEVTDPIRNFNDYGFTMCSTISGINQSLFEALGLPHQYWDICNHTVSAVEYGSKFRMIDSSMSHLVTTDDGVSLASVQEAAADSARLVREHSLYSTSAGGFLTGSDGARTLVDAVNPENGSITNGFADNFCSGALKLRDYFYNWDSGHRFVLNIRDDESYTRYYRRLGTTADYWVPSERVSASDPGDTFEIDSTNRFRIRGNGSWSFVPRLTTDAWAAAAYRSENVAAAAAGGLQPAIAGQMSEVVYKVQAGNAITSQQIQAEFAKADALASGVMAVSTNHGATWTEVASLAGEVGIPLSLGVNLRAQVSGAYETLLRVQMQADSSSPAGIRLTRLQIDTLTQVNTKALPKLNVGRNEIFVGAGDQTDTMVLWPELRADFWKKDVYDSANIASQTVGVPRKYTAVAYPAVLTQDAHLTYRMQAPTDIVRLVYGGRLHNYAAGSYIDFLHSFDGGASWVRSYRLSDVSKPHDVIHFETVTEVPPGVRTVLFKFLIHNTNTTAARASGLYSARMEVNHRPIAGVDRPMDVTWRWKEVQPDRTLLERSHRQRVETFPFRYVVNVGGGDHPVMESIKVNVENPGDPTPYGYSDGGDVGGPRFVHRRRMYDGSNVARGMPYTMSTAPSGFQASAGASNTTILTDGVVGAPATGGNSYWWGQCWTAGTTVDLQVDLGAPRTVAAFRAHLFGYPFWDALKGQVQDRVEVLTSANGTDFISRGLIPLSLWKKDVPINHMLQDDETATGWNFELTTEAVSARYVRYRMTPKRILCASEFQVLDHVDYAPFDIQVAVPVSGSPGDTTPPQVTVTAPSNGATVTGSVAVTATATDDVGVTQVEFLVNGTVVGSGTTPPYAVTWDSTGTAPGTAVITARAADAALNVGTSAPVSVTLAGIPPEPEEIVLWALQATRVAGAWRLEPDASAAGGWRVRHPNAGAARIATPLAAPTHYFELTFIANANVPYHLWLRGRADSNTWPNDSVYVQFSNVAAFPIGTTQATTVTLEDCTNCGVSGWGWQDNALNALAAPVTFAAAGPQTIRIQTREDGLAIDQIILSPTRFLTTSPGALKNDTTIYVATGDVPADGTPPDVCVTAPSNGATVTGSVGLTATATDNIGVTQVEFRVNGTVVGRDTTAPYAVTWDATGTATGTAVITARAVDAALNVGTSAPVSVTLASVPPRPEEIVLWALQAMRVAGAWRLEPDASAAGGWRVRHPNAGAARIATPLAAPTHYFELTFIADANVPYHLWLRGRADSNHWSNDSVYVQFTNIAAFEIGTTRATTVSLENCITVCPISGWGWQDNAYDALAAPVTFATGGPQTLRIQTREDGLAIDQIILSPARFLTSSPGALTNDTTIYQR